MAIVEVVVAFVALLCRLLSVALLGQQSVLTTGQSIEHTREPCVTDSGCEDPSLDNSLNVKGNNTEVS